MPELDLGQVVGSQGPQGPQGIQGPQGNTGPQGVPGANGITPNIQVGTVTTLPPGSDATVTRQPDSPDAAPVFDFALPRGADSNSKGDMKAATYDPTGKEQDIFSYADTKSETALESAKTYASQYGYSKEETLTEAICTALGLSTASVPSQVLDKLRQLVNSAQSTASSAQSTASSAYSTANSAYNSANSRARIETGSYTGTGSGTTGDAKTINFSIPWKFFFNLIIPAYIDSAYASGGLYVCSYDGSRIVNLTNNGQLYEFTKTSYSITVPKYMNNTTNYYYYMAIA